MHKESGQSPRQSLMKRKRRSSEGSSSCNDENVPLIKEKKQKLDGKPCELGEASTSGTDVDCGRLPLSELSLFDRKTSGSHSQHSDDENSIDDLICEQERLSISDCDSNPPSVGSTITNVQSPDAHELSDIEEGDGEVYEELDAEYYECSPQEARCGAGVFDGPSTSFQAASQEDSYGQLTPASNATCTPSSSSNMKAGERRQTLPQLRWADKDELWTVMCNKDEDSLTSRDPDLFIRHPNLQPRMRSVLLDWIIEVCEVYKLHRETYYLTMDYLDRYLTTRHQVPKQQLQLIGITCLLIAAKMEEIYPPKVADFAYVTDGACTEEEILKMELAILKTLNWELSPVTINNWLTTYLQLCYKDQAQHTLGFIFPQFSGQLFTRISQLLDLATLDIGCLNYSYSTLAASCLYLACSKRLALHVSGLPESEIKPCVGWMQAFWEVLQEEVPEQRESRCFPPLPPGPGKKTFLDDSHNLQVHTITLEMLEAADDKKFGKKSQPDLNYLTPPSSSQKRIAAQANSYT